MVLFGGAFLTVGFTFFFGAENLRAQVLMTGALSVLIFAGLLTVVAIDHPFAGTVKVGPEALAAVIKDFAELRHSDSQGPLLAQSGHFTFALHMSAFEGKADIGLCAAHVRF